MTFGGATALRGYFLDGLRYRTLTIFDAMALAPRGSGFVRHMRGHGAAFAGMPDDMHRALLDADLQTAAAQPLTSEALALYRRPWLGPVRQPAFYRQIAQMDQRFTDEVQGLSRRLDCPVRVLWGTEDAWIPIGKGRALAGLISDLPLLAVEGAGHLMQEDRPEAILGAVLGNLLRPG